MPAAYVFTAYGGPEFQAFIERDKPVAGPGELVIAVHAIGVNPVDWKIREGYMRERFPRELPAILGREVAGVVDQVGDGVEGFAVADEVLGQAPSGACAEYAVLPAATTAHKPKGVSFDDAASLPVAAATAYSAVTEIGVRRDETLLVVGAGGGVGSAAVRIARHLGARVIGIASPAKAAFVESLGAHHVPYGPGVEERIRAHAPDGVDAVFDLVGGDALRAVSGVVGDPARIVTAADGATAGELGGFHVRRTDPDLVLAAVVRLMAAGELASSVTQVFPFEHAGDALAAVESGHATGKIVVAVRPSPGGRERQSES